MRFIGITVKPSKWNIQADYSIAQLRAGNIYNARKENEKLLKKSTKLSEGQGRGLRYRTERNVRTFKSLNRKFIIHRALIEAHAKKHQEAKEFLSKALQIHEVDEIKKSQSFIIGEIESLIKSSKNKTFIRPRSLLGFIYLHEWLLHKPKNIFPYGRSNSPSL